MWALLHVLLLDFYFTLCFKFVFLRKDVYPFLFYSSYINPVELRYEDSMSGTGFIMSGTGFIR